MWVARSGHANQGVNEPQQTVNLADVPNQGSIKSWQLAIHCCGF
jgi:hypothetical protein